jgi:hypothetical protein
MMVAVPRLRRVEAWPATRHVDRPWHVDSDIAAFLASSRGIFEVYSDELVAAGQTARASSIRFFIDEVECHQFEVFPLRGFVEGFDPVHLAIPASFHTVTEGARSNAVLDVIDTAVQALAELRGWDAASLAKVRGRVEQRGLRFTWASDWKSARGRRHQARCVYWIDDDGHGRAQVEIRDAEGSLVARSEPALAFMTSDGFKRSAATLRWSDSATVAVVPFIGLLRDDRGGLQLRVDGPVAPSGLPPSAPVSDHRVEVRVTVRSGDEWADDPDLEWTYVQAIDTAGTGAYGREFERVVNLIAAAPGFAAWWAQTPYRRLIMRISVPDPRYLEFAPKAGARKNGKDLLLQVVTDRASLPSRTDMETLKARARRDVYEALTDLAASRNLGAPPPPIPPG